MGSSQRQIVEDAEKIVVKLLNAEPLTEIERNHKFTSLIQKFIIRLRADYPTFKRAEHLGNDYNTIGDISILLDDDKFIHVELKFLAGGKGTLANISQDSLTSLGLFDCISWSEFRKEKRHRETVIDFINGNPPYQDLSTNCSDSLLYSRANDFKDELSVGKRNTRIVCDEIIDDNQESQINKSLAKSILNIMDFDKEIKLNYLKLLKESGFDQKRIKLFCLALLIGRHKHQHIRSFIETYLGDELEILNLADDFKTYYLYKPTNSIKKDDLLSSLKLILENEIDISMEPFETSLVIFSKKTDEIIPIISISLHWKNKFQGIETPCLNIFDLLD